MYFRSSLNSSVMKLSFLFFIIIALSILLGGCGKNDDLRPILTLKGEDSISLVLNTEFTDPGAEATDETDGNITKNIFIDNNVDINRIGEYTINYHVTDQAGNEAIPVTRYVSVYNQGFIYSWMYSVNEVQIYPGNDHCTYDLFILPDSSVNNRLVFTTFSCALGKAVYANISDSSLIIPFQQFVDSINTTSLQGSGSINDTAIILDYTLKSDSLTELWSSEIIRMK
jgi:hypothetical protein